MTKIRLILFFSMLAIIAILSYLLSNSYGKIDNLTTILTDKEQIIKNKTAQNASIVRQYNAEYVDMRNAYDKESNLRSDYEKKLAQAYKDIDNYKRKVKDLVNYTSVQIEAGDTVYLPMPADCQRIEPIKQKHIELDFVYDTNNRLTAIPYRYNARIYTLVQFTPKKKANGKKHFPNWGVIWGWDTNSITTIDDSNATVYNQVSISFKK